jgi:hypothetical protein
VRRIAVFVPPMSTPTMRRPSVSGRRLVVIG